MLSWACPYAIINTSKKSVTVIAAEIRGEALE
jgi:hypothetical protein